MWNTFDGLYIRRIYVSHSLSKINLVLRIKMCHARHFVLRSKIIRSSLASAQAESQEPLPSCSFTGYSFRCDTQPHKNLRHYDHALHTHPLPIAHGWIFDFRLRFQRSAPIHAFLTVIITQVGKLAAVYCIFLQIMWTIRTYIISWWFNANLVADASVVCDIWGKVCTSHKQLNFI